MKETYNFKIIEKEVLELWNKKQTYKKAKEKNKGKKKYYFLDGPPYTSGRVHIGTAWNKSLKDSFIRYKRMKGLDIWDRAGYDMHGLPTENATQKKIGLKTKEDIENYGVNKFISECKKLCIENMKTMNEDFKRIGVWMDFENAYQSVTKEFMEGEWWLIKKAHENKRLYEGLRTMTWCPITESALAKHELEYHTVKEPSIFVKLKLKNKENEYLVIWTTTPWTIPFNLAVMAGPDIDYVKAKVENEVWYVASKLAGVFISGVADKKFEILKEMKGEELEGLEYEHPFYKEIQPIYDEIKSKSEKTFTVLLSNEYVDTTAGSGLVHCAPGCGPEDYEVGHRNGIPPFNNLDKKGVFPKNMGKFAGLTAKKDDLKFIKALEECGALIATTEVEHEYPHDWRHQKPVIFRTTKQWFFKIEDLKEQMLKEHSKTTWVPEAAYNAFESWLKNLRDNSVSKQRFWGTPLPIWRNTENPEDYMVIGSAKELEELSGTKVEDLHINTVDKIEIKKNGKTYKRVPDILDVWVDAGTTSWTCLDYPQREDLLKELFPADFILEGKDQIRGWFNLLLVASMISMNKHSFKNVYMHGFIQDAQGRKMSKSLGNQIRPDELIDKYGADTLRYYTISAAKPGLDMNYNFDDTEVKYRNLLVFWNIQHLITDLAKNIGSKPKILDYKKIGLEEKYIISKLHSTIKETTNFFETFKINETPNAPENLLLELSRNYIQLIREKSVTGSDEQKKIILNVMFEVYLKALTLLAPITPFITEKIYQNLKKEFELEEESIHLIDWPKHDDKMINKELELSFETAGRIIASGLACRDQANIGVRWPLKKLIINTDKKEVRTAVEKLSEIIKSQVNVKEVSFEKVKLNYEIKPNYSKLGKKFGQQTPKVGELIKENEEQIIKELEQDKIKISDYEITTKEDLEIKKIVPEEYKLSEFIGTKVYLEVTTTKELEQEGYAREIVRRIQNLRKNSKLNKEEKIELTIETTEEWLNGFKEYIKQKVNAKKVEITSKKNEKYDSEKKEKIKDKEFNLKFNKL